MKNKNKAIFICLSGNGCLNFSSLRKMIYYASKFGYNQVELGLDDMIKVDNEPYYGYLRGGYTIEELKQLDDYAYSLGIELIPSCQFLAHFGYLNKIPEYESIIDIDDILLIDEKRTYQLIENIFISLRKAFRTNKINIAFDEANHVGLGKYLEKHGYHDKFSLLSKHLNKVLSIADKYNFKAHMWSDMFFKLVNNGVYYSSDVTFNKEQLELIPNNVNLCYWDYYTKDENILNHMMKQHVLIDKDCYFAGTIFTCSGFAPSNIASIDLLKIQIASAKRNNIQNYIITLWPDNGNDCSYFNALPGLFVASKLIDDIKEEDINHEDFKEIVGLDFKKYLVLDKLNISFYNQDLKQVNVTCKSLLYNDLFLGWKDYELEKILPIDYKSIVIELDETIPFISNPDVKLRFIKLRHLANCLSYKYDLGIKTRLYYKNRDYKSLKKLIPIYEEVLSTLLDFRSAFYDEWMKENKPHGWDVQEIRLGGLYFRVQNCKNRLLDLINHKIDKIEELDETLLKYAKFDSLFNSYQGFVTVRNI